jgi:hypothetical protein
MNPLFASLIEKGIAKPCSFADIDKYDYKGVPPVKGDIWHLTGHNSFEVNAPFDLFQTHLESLLTGIEGIRSVWNPAHCVWNIEYGTRPMEHNSEGKDFQQIMRGKSVAIHAACTASQRFPEVFNDDELWNLTNVNNINLPIPERAGFWCKMRLSIYIDKKKNCLFIHLNRLCGDHTTHFVIFSEVTRYFKENAIYLSRAAYLSAIKDYVYDPENPHHILRYVGDAMVTREICSFIPYK